jgi:hypothetical protein
VIGREQIRQAPYAHESLTITLDEAATLQPDEALIGAWDVTLPKSRPVAFRAV